MNKETAYQYDDGGSLSIKYPLCFFGLFDRYREIATVDEEELLS